MPIRFLPFLPSPAPEEAAVRPLRVVVTGAECTGKTTLARDLAERLGASVVPEAARLYAEEHPDLTAADVQPIADLHVRLADAAEERARETSASVLVLDTDLVSTVVYARHLYGDDAVPLRVAQTSEERRADLYLLCTPEGITWEPDPGQRAATSAVRAATHPLFADALGVLGWLHGTRVVTLTGTPEERLHRALAAITAAQLDAA